MLEFGGPVGATRLAERVAESGIRLQPRTIRFHLLRLDREGLTRFINRRRGRELTARGREEVGRANVIEKVGFIAARIESLGYRMTFRADEGRGTIIANVATIGAGLLVRALEFMKPVFARRLGVGRRLAVAREGQSIGGFAVPAGQVALGTVCSMTVNGALLAERIPLAARFGGLLEMREGRPVRFVELVEYRGTTIDPLEFLIGANMTSVRECAQTGSGVVGASFREFPSVALGEVQRIMRSMERHDLAAILAIGQPGRPLLNIPVTEGRTGMVVLGGLNPVAALHEARVPVSIRSLAGLEDASSFLSFEALRQRING
jgi:hypothetical protein